MKKPIHKIAFLFGLYVALHFVAACMREPDLNCTCPGVDFPFFDYKSLTVTPNDPTVESALHLDVVPMEIIFLAAAERPASHFDFITTAWGCDCAFNGYYGPKYSVTTLNIFADRAFDDSHPVDSSLTSLFTFTQHDLGLDFDYPSPTITFTQGTLSSLRFTTYTRPKDQAPPIRFTLQFIKSNNDTVSIQTDNIRFQ